MLVLRVLTTISLASLTLASLTLASLTLASPDVYCENGECKKGEIYHNEECVQCPEGSYMPFDSHACKDCFKCSQISGANQIIITNCTAENDTVIGCKPGSILAGPNTPDSRQCIEVKRNRTGNTDTPSTPATTTTGIPASMRQAVHTTVPVNTTDEFTFHAVNVSTTTASPEVSSDLNTSAKYYIIGVFVFLAGTLIALYIFRRQICALFRTLGISWTPISQSDREHGDPTAENDRTDTSFSSTV